MFKVPVAECLTPILAMTHSIDNDKNITISFIVLFVISVVVNIVLIATIMLFGRNSAATHQMCKLYSLLLGVVILHAVDRTACSCL